ncbi:class I SAM-dependent methyltransferase [Marinimicrococcus flavescens]|uniref:Class I SAM-dependent methyltransferase n=1 Tax=Marinimicrococcus flavescens TaxID=3031815 RepID=A0AAP3XQ25_9PROT|nr:class I SAM-dependent methyltransferase [Marinimicrococcus flavescens]
MVVERIELTRTETEALERDINLRRHVERYATARQFLFGTVLDASCGVGYGSWLCQKNPDVDLVLGIDADPAAVAWARQHFTTQKTRFECCRIEDFPARKIDVLLSLETVEHLEHPEALAELAGRCAAEEVVVSFPQKKTTHYNGFHRWDLSAQDLLDMFTGFARTATIDQNSDYLLLHLVRLRPRHHAARRWRLAEAG